MSDPVVGLILLATLFVFLAGGLWIALSLTAVAAVALAFFSNSSVGLNLAVTFWGHSHSWSLTALPLFILMGEILLRSRLSRDMFNGLAPWLGGLPGRLLHVNVLGCAIFAAVSGSSAATAATIGKMSIPELKSRGYPEGLILGTLAGSATLGLLIPPSIILIVYGVATEQSIARLFVAGLIPGAMLVTLFGAYVAIRAWMNPDLIPVDTTRMSLREKLWEARGLIPVALLIAGVIGAIYTGMASPTDAAALGVLLSILLATLSGSFKMRDFLDALLSATRTSCMIAFILLGAAFLAVVPDRLDGDALQMCLVLHHGQRVFERGQIREEVLRGGAGGEPRLQGVRVGGRQVRRPTDCIGQFQHGRHPQAAIEVVVQEGLGGCTHRIGGDRCRHQCAPPGR
jgi:tripartite ATP-independent transporter DctM subunit